MNPVFLSSGQQSLSSVTSSVDVMRVAFGGVGVGATLHSSRLIPPSHGNAFSITLIAILLTTSAPQGVFNFSSVSFVQINVRLLAVLVPLFVFLPLLPND